MKIFLSFASEDRDDAHRIYLTLMGDGHKVFFDKTSLPPGANFNQQIRKAIKQSDLFLVLISRAYLEDSRYRHSERELAEEKWPKPWGHVISVMLEKLKKTELAKLHPYLSMGTFLQPEADVTIEVAAAIEAMGPTREHFIGKWSWVDGGIEFIITFDKAGTFSATSSVGVGPAGVIKHFNGIWSLEDNRLVVQQTHWSFGKLAKQFSSTWIDSDVKRFAGIEVSLEDGSRLQRVSLE